MADLNWIQAISDGSINHIIGVVTSIAIMAYLASKDLALNQQKLNSK